MGVPDYFGTVQETVPEAGSVREARGAEAGGAKTRWGEDLGAPLIRLTLGLDRAGFEPRRGHAIVFSASESPTLSWLLQPNERRRQLVPQNRVVSETESGHYPALRFCGQ